MISIPKSIQYDISKAQLMIRTIPARMNVETEKGELEITRYPLQMQLDNTEFFESLGFKSIDAMAIENIQYGKRAVANAMERYAMEKNAMLRPNGPTLGQLAAQRMHRTIQSALEFIPKSRPNVKWTGGYVEIKYNKDTKHITWEPSKVEYDYIPYSVSFSVSEWKDVQGLAPTDETDKNIEEQ